MKRYNVQKSLAKMSSRELQVEIMKMILLGVLVASMFVLPSMAPVYKLFGAKKSSDRLRLRRTFDSLKKQKKISFLQNGKKVHVMDQGIEFCTETELLSLAYTPPKVWNKEWYLVMFDLPVNREKERKLFRTKLQDLGFVSYQDSVYLFPHQCSKIIKEMCTILDIERYVCDVVAIDVTGSKQLKKQFKL